MITILALEEKLAEAHTAIAELQKENDRLLTALEFYAMPEHEWVRSAALAADKGYVARKALEGK